MLSFDVKHGILNVHTDESIAIFDISARRLRRRGPRRTTHVAQPEIYTPFSRVSSPNGDRATTYKQRMSLYGMNKSCVHFIFILTRVNKHSLQSVDAKGPWQVVDVALLDWSAAPGTDALETWNWCICFFNKEPLGAVENYFHVNRCVP